MPRHYKRKRTYRRSKKRVVKRRRTNRKLSSRSTTHIRAPSFMPDVLYTTLKFAETTALAITASDFFTQEYEGNGIFDPSAFGNTSCLGFTELMGIYNLYQVISSSIVIKFQNPSVINSMECSLIPTQNFATIDFDPMDYAMNLRGKGAFLTPSGGSKDMVTLRASATSRAIFGQSLTQASFFGTPSTNPATAWKWVFSVKYPVAVTESVPIQVFMRYRCKFVRKDLIDPTLPGLEAAPTEEMNDQ